MEIEIEVSPEEFQTFVEKATNDLGKNVKVDGFREGKVPKDIVEQKIGKDIIFREAGDQAIKGKYLQAISENKLEPISPPEIKILKLAPGNPLIFKAHFPVLPKVHLPDLKKISSTLKKIEAKISEEEIEKALLQLQKSRAKFSQVFRPAQKGDFVEIEFTSSEIEMGKKQKDGFLLGQAHLIPGFEEKLEGMRAEEEKDFSLQFPEKHFQKNFSSRKAHFHVRMESVQKMELPELNDQFAKSLGDFENLKFLKLSIKEGLRSEKETLERQRIRQEILNQIAEKISWDIPDVLFKAEKNRIIEDLKSKVTSQLKMNFPEYLAKMNTSEKDLRDSFQKEAERKIKNSLILREISKVENIAVNEEEVEAEINKMLRQYPDFGKTEKELDPHTKRGQGARGTKTDEVSPRYGVGVDLEKLKDYYKESLRNEKAFQLLENLMQK